MGVGTWRTWSGLCIWLEGLEDAEDGEVGNESVVSVELYTCAGPRVRDERCLGAGKGLSHLISRILDVTRREASSFDSRVCCCSSSVGARAFS